MQIAKHKVVTFDYTLKNEDGTVIENSKASGPFRYVHGIGTTITGLETALEAKSVGDTLTVSLLPEQAYSERNESLVHVVPRDRFEVGEEVRVGMQFQVRSDAGVRVVTVVKIDADDITVDGNHPLAGGDPDFHRYHPRRA